MTKFTRQIISVMASGAVMLNVAAPVFAGTTSITISGNGSSSDNTANVQTVTTTTVTQNNVANVTNNVTSNATTGGNTAKDNTGGAVDIHTGDATNVVDVRNNLNTNTADVTCCATGATDVTITGNGSDSENTANVNSNDHHYRGPSVQSQSSTLVSQDNVAEVKNKVDAEAKTGYNQASDNTGGDVSIHTGAALTDMYVNNALNTNTAKVDCCGVQDASVTISGNGAHTENSARLALESTTALLQDNHAKVKNYVDADATTGGNDAKDNTGGEVSIHTDDATSIAKVLTTANANLAQVGGGLGTHAGSVSLKILDNGAHTENDIDLLLSKETTVFQDNYAFVTNHVNADASTGKNSVKDSTGGENAIHTGEAYAKSWVENEVNFNSASLDCGCLLDVTAKVAGNGTDSENDIRAALADIRGVYQGGQEGLGNLAYLYNTLGADAKTGWNEMRDGTVGSELDPAVTTGDAATVNVVRNTGNTNVFGAGVLTLPHFDFSFDMSMTWVQMMQFMHLM